MDQYTQVLIEKKLERTAAALKKHRFDAHVVSGRAALPAKLKELMPEGISCSVGGSMTLFEAGVIDFLRRENYRFFDRHAEGVDIERCYRDAMGCDVYLMSSNAVTEKGELYNVDGRGNRVAALIYGPAKVIVIAGHNKIVPDLEAARERNRRLAAPANALRLGKETLPCYHTGVCSDCNSPGRICAFEVVAGSQMIPGRITVLLVGEELGY